MKYILPRQLVYLHQRIIEETGGTHGTRDAGLLESAAYRSQATFGGNDLYPGLFSKAAALGHSIIKNHPFIDGNKRVGFEAMRLMLRLNERDLRAHADDKYDFVMKIAESKRSEQQIADWLKTHSKPYK